MEEQKDTVVPAPRGRGRPKKGEEVPKKPKKPVGRPKKIPDKPVKVKNARKGVKSASSPLSYLPYHEATEIIRSKQFTSMNQHNMWIIENKPAGLPLKAHLVYRHHNFSWDFYLGDAYIQRKNIKTLSNAWTFEQAREFARRLCLRTVDDWMNYVQTQPIPVEIPRHPHIFYKKNKTWTNWEDFLGSTMRKIIKRNEGKVGLVIDDPNELPSFKSKAFSLPFDQFRRNVQSMMFNSQEEYHTWCITNNKCIEGYPLDPAATYASRRQWTTWHDVLGKYDPMSPQYHLKCEYIEAKRFAQSLNIQTEIEWRNFWLKHTDYRPDIPRYPNDYYKRDWENWAVFLGTQISYRLDAQLYEGAVLYVAHTSKAVRNVYEVGICNEGINSLLNTIYISHQDWMLIKCFKFSDKVINSIHKNSRTYVEKLIDSYHSGEHYGFDGVIIDDIYGLLSDLDYYFEPIDIKSISVKLDPSLSKDRPETAAEEKASKHVDRVMSAL